MSQCGVALRIDLSASGSAGGLTDEHARSCHRQPREPVREQTTTPSRRFDNLRHQPN